MRGEIRFPDGFFWGAATAAYQVEGGIEKCDWAEAARDGKVPPCGKACDHYNRYEGDFDIAVSLGHNCHRLSVEWARIEPYEGKFDEKEIAHYRAVLLALRARNLEPFVTIWHFTLPLWFSEMGGFEHKRSPELFARYATYVAEKLGDLCAHFSTINEPLPYASNGWRRGTWPPFRKWPGIDGIATTATGSFDTKATVSVKHIWRYFAVIRNLARAHNAAYDAIKKVRDDAEVGIVMHVVLFHANKNPFNMLLAWLMNEHWTHSFMRKVARKCDVIGLNYYVHKKFGDTKVYDKTDMGWDVYPEGICDALLLLKRYGKPVYVSEAGVADAADRIRADYIKGLVSCMWVALQNGMDVRGFMYWSLLDNYEWAHGFEKRFGLVEIYYKTLERRIRPSAYVYKEIIGRNVLVDPVR